MEETDHNTLLNEKMKAEQDKYRTGCSVSHPKKSSIALTNNTMKADIMICIYAAAY